MKIQIKHFDCPEQKVHSQKESYLELEEDLLRFVFIGELQTMDEDTAIFSEVKYIDQHFVCKRENVSSYYVYYSNKADAWVIQLYVSWSGEDPMVRFKTETRARDAAKIIHDWIFKTK